VTGVVGIYCEASSRGCSTAFAGWLPMMALPHCGQCQPASVRTIAIRQIGQERMVNGRSWRMPPQCARSTAGTIQETPYP